jgi:nucleotide-binding universal stress UspA family protein
MVPYQRILLPLDGSELAERALAPAQTICQAMNCDLHLLRVVSGLAFDLDPLFHQRCLDADVEAAWHYLNALKKQNTTFLPAIANVITGSPPKVIIDYAAQHAVDLIILSSHGATGFSRWVYGNVTSKITRQAPCDSLIVRTTASAVKPFSTQRLMVPLDGSKLAEKALEPAVALASYLELNILLFRVSPLITPEFEPIGCGSLYDGLEAQARKEAGTYLSQLQSSLGNSGLSIQAASVTGHDAKAIVDYAGNHDVDLIIMSSHGATGIGRWLIGNVTEKVLRKANCSTLVVRC